MKPTKGYYCLIQYCPDLSRLEAANIGVLLFCPDRLFLQARTARDNRRIQHFFGREDHDWSQINSFKIGIEERLEVEHPNIQTLDDLQRFIQLLANQIQITAPRPMRVRVPEEDLDRLFQDLVGGQHRKQKSTSFKRHVGDRFANAAGLESKIARDVSIHVPISNRDIEIPYGYQNGRFNLIQPVTFQSKEPANDISKACRFAVEGHSLHETQNPRYGDVQLVVVGRFLSQGGDTKADVGRILKEHEVQLYAEEHLSDLIDEIRRTGKVLQRVNDQD
ncbi:MAG: DUF3037 domain-containing protein [Planctomycetia bacterium]|nr:DUF3037 domain-containing protein [Planctomycetia bacterium]